MKSLAIFTISVLIFAAASVSLADTAHAQKDPYILLNIATQADEQIVNQLETIYGDSIPSDIQTLYQNGHDAVQSLKDSVSDDVQEAEENFLVAMKAFKQITKMLSASTFQSNNTARDLDDRDLQSELIRLHNYFQNIKAISEKHHTGIDLSDIEELFTRAHEQIDSEELEAASQTIEQLESLVEEIKQDIHKHDSHSASDRNRNFALKQLDKIKATLNVAQSTDPDMPELEEANLLVIEIETLISEDSISDVKEKFTELTKLVKVIKELSNQT